MAHREFIQPANPNSLSLSFSLSLSLSLWLCMEIPNKSTTAPWKMNNNRHQTPSKSSFLPKSLLLIYDHQKPWWDQILDPGSEFANQWNHIFMVTCLIALFLDPMYFYLPKIGGRVCMSMDVGLGVFITVLRCVVDLFSVLHMAMKFRTAYVAPSSRVFGRGELVTDPWLISKQYLKSDFLIDLAATLPLPQTIFSPQGAKKQHFSMMQESARKDVEQAFRVLQSRFAIVGGPVRFWDPKILGDIMKTCIILHNMMVDNERDSYLDLDYEISSSTSTVVLSTTGNNDFESFMSHHLGIRDKNICGSFMVKSNLTMWTKG